MTLATLAGTCAGLLGAASAAFAQEAKPWQLGLQPAATPVAERIHDFHDLLLVITIAIVVFVSLLLAWVMIRFNARANPTPSRTTHNTFVEVLWTVVPVMILVVIAIPSFRLLYFMDRAVTPEMTLKVTGHQWYWSYEYPDHGGVAFDSLMIPENELKPDQRRLLEVDNRAVVPVGTDIRVLLTAADVLHSWAVPALGIKTDTVPGRLNETWMRIERPGVYYGQCSELCGVNHAFMPVAVEAVSKAAFEEWVESRKKAAARTPAVPPLLAGGEAPAAPGGVIR
ncbi:MAG TPA: cytochrome c oxidase subunit II [Alphaproteobacteria bacterium]